MAWFVAGNDLSRSFNWGPEFMWSWIKGHAGIYNTLNKVRGAVGQERLLAVADAAFSKADKMSRGSRQWSKSFVCHAASVHHGSRFELSRQKRLGKGSTLLGGNLAGVCLFGRCCSTGILLHSCLTCSFILTSLKSLASLLSPSPHLCLTPRSYLFNHTS